jgi:thioredoxin-like negative regulator of GroEL
MRQQSLARSANFEYQRIDLNSMRMKIFPAILILVLGLASIARAEAPAGWSTNYAAALSEAAGEHKPALVFFTASWCGPCKMMSRSTLSESPVQQALSNFVRVAIDIDEQHDLALQHGIEAVPTFVLLSPAGDEVQRATGFQAAGDFVPWLTNGLSGAREAALTKALARKRLADVDQLLVSTNADAPRQCATNLFDLCAGHDEAMVKLAAERLTVLASHQPAALLDGLSDGRLAVRIQVANALRVRLGEEFNVDPWGEAAARAAAIEKWRGHLATHH